MKALMIMNPVSGKMGLIRHYAEIVQLLKDAGYALDIRCTSGKGSAQEIVKSSAPQNDLIICAGGDGTLNDIINGVMEAGLTMPIGYIPCGTTNDFASSVGLSKNVIKAAKDIITGCVTSVDVGQFGNTYFSYVASFGAFTQSSYTTPQARKNTLGYFAYVLEGVRELPFLKPTRLTLTTSGGDVYSGEYVLGAIANSTSIAGIIKLDSSRVDISDGEFEVLLVKAPKTFMDLNNIIIALNTNDFDNPLIHFFRAKELTVESEAPIQWSLDGEFFESKPLETIKNHQKAVHIILPKKD